MHQADVDSRTAQSVGALRFLRGSRPATGIVLVTAWGLLLALGVAGIHERASHHVIFGHHGVEFVDIAIFATVWMLMVIGMMLPPALVSRPAGSCWNPRSAWLRSAIEANITVWGLFGVALLAVDGIAHRLALSVPALSDPVLPVAVLAAAGLYQLLPVKRRFLAEVRRATSPWQHTLACLGSYWALMTVLFALGAASLLWMATLTVVMMLEQHHRMGHLVAGAVGVALLGASVLAASV